jgi:hypothetical protein
LLGAGEMDLVLQSKLHRLLEGIQHVVASEQEKDDVRVRGLRFN